MAAIAAAAIRPRNDVVGQDRGEGALVFGLNPALDSARGEKPYARLAIVLKSLALELPAGLLQLIDPLRTHRVDHMPEFLDLRAEPFELVLGDAVVL